jgi:hypothetical protein
MAEFKKLSEVEMLESASDNATVLIEEGGDIKRVPKGAVGGAGGVGGYIATVTMDDLEMSMGNMMIISENYDALYDVLNAGGSAWIDFSIMNSMAPSNVMSGSSSNTPSYPSPSVFGKMIGIIVSWTITDVGLICGAILEDSTIPVMFPNGSHNLEQFES